MNLIKRMISLKGIPTTFLNGKKNRYLVYPEDNQLVIESDGFVAKVDYKYEDLEKKKVSEMLLIIENLLTTKNELL